MKQLKPYLFNLTLSLFLSASCYLSAQTNSTLNDYQQVKSSVSASPTIGVIDTRKCLEESKLSKHERVALEKMKAKMESVLKEKQKARFMYGIVEKQFRNYYKTAIRRDG